MTVISEAFMKLSDSLDWFMKEYKLHYPTDKMSDVWSVKDILCHITYWHRYYVKNLTSEERRGLGLLSEKIEDKTAAEIHDLVYAVAKDLGIDSKTFFQAIYLAFIGERQGPKVGWFLASLERDFVKTRLKEAAAA